MRAVLIAVAMLGAGCMSDAPEAPAASANEPLVASTGAIVSEDGTTFSPATIAALAAPVDKTLWFNGTFTIDKHGRAVGYLPGSPGELVGEPTNQVRFDISADVPRNVPVRLIVEVDAEVQNGDVDLWPQIPPGEWRTGNWNMPRGGYSRFEVGFVHVSTEPVAIVLAYDEMDTQPEFPYVLSARIVADPTLLVNGMVAGVDLPADASFLVEVVGEKREQEIYEAIQLVLFDPADEYLGAFPLAEDAPTPIALPAGSAAGEYVLMLSQGGRNARVLVEGVVAAMRPLDQDFAVEEPIVGDSAGHVAWTQDLDRVPLLVGMEWRAPNVGMSVDVALVGPEGPLISGSIEGGPFMSLALPGGPTFADGFGWDTGYGAPGLVAGTYQGEIAFEQAAGAQNVQVWPYAAFYMR